MTSKTALMIIKNSRDENITMEVELIFEELVERDTPKKVIRDKNTSVISAYCPKCNRVVDSGQIGCPYCLQRISWSEYDEK